MKEELFNKRSFLISDYISQILVYGSNTNGSIGINKSQFDDGNYLILTVSVIKNSYFRWHDLGIKITDSLEFYKVVLSEIIDKFKDFDILFIENGLKISSKVNNNCIDISFTLNNKKTKDWFASEKEIFYNNLKQVI